MAGDTTPQNQAHALLAENFRWLMDIRPLVLTDIVDCLADAGLLCSSPVVQPKQDEGRSAPEPPASDGRSDIYVTVSREQVHRTRCHSDNTVNVDLDRNGVPVGIEIIGAIEVTIDGQVVGDA